MTTPSTEPILYQSTRSGGTPCSFQDALMQGLAPDGGLFVPVRVPQVTPEVWSASDDFAGMSYPILSRWLKDEVPAEVLHDIVYDALNFPVPLVPLAGGTWEGIHVLELFHGPTLSFKDFGARTMARLMAYFARQRQQQLTILVATSGDTGSAVADGFAGQEGIDVILLYPNGQVSPVQERQLIVQRPNVQAFAVEGTFDDCQRMVKAAFMDPDMAGLNLSSANSINIGRLLPQMLYYFWAYRQSGLSEATFCVPSGNLGNLTGGMLAALSGLPVTRFVAAHNANDFFPRFLQGDDVAFGDSLRTLSNAMDVGAPSNFERLLTLLGPDRLRQKVWGDQGITNEETLSTIQQVYQETGYLTDPHTAVGLLTAQRYRHTTAPLAPIMVLSTAHPAKFPETLEQALGISPELPERLAAIWKQETQRHVIAPELDSLKAFLLSSV